MGRISISLTLFILLSIQVALFSKVASPAEVTFEIVHSFTQPPSRPSTALLEATDGSFYGTTKDGGAGGLGTVFRLEPTGQLTTLHSFSGPDGAFPEAALIKAADGGLQRPGDCDQNGRLELTDGICLLGFLFRSQPSRLPCGDGSLTDPANVLLLDFDSNLRLELTDGVRIFQYLFAGGSPHPLCSSEECVECERLPGCRDACQL